MAEAVKHLPAATVYATFVGIGIAGTATVGMLFFGESTNVGRICSLTLIAIGVIGLKFFSKRHRLTTTAKPDRLDRRAADAEQYGGNCLRGVT